MVAVGIDLVHVPKIEKLLRSEEAARKVFHPSELKDNMPEHLAGVFAAKEAYFKALKQKPDWLSVEVITKESGEPEIKAAAKNVAKPILSISHDGEYAVAVVVIDQTPKWKR